MNPGEDVDAPPGIHGNHLLRPEAEAERDLELLAQRHEVAILSRQVKRPELLPAGRFLRAALGRRLPVGRLVFTPATILRWHQGTGPSPLLCFRTSTSPWSAADPRELRSLIVRMTIHLPPRHRGGPACPRAAAIATGRLTMPRTELQRIGRLIEAFHSCCSGSAPDMASSRWRC